MSTAIFIDAPPVAAPSPEGIAGKGRQEDRPLAAATATVAPRAAGWVTAPPIDSCGFPNTWMRKTEHLALDWDARVWLRGEEAECLGSIESNDVPPELEDELAILKDAHADALWDAKAEAEDAYARSRFSWR